MTIAETHGKISSTGRNLHDQMEDLLTSDVFSACKYLKPSTLLLPFLSTAASLAGTNLDLGQAAPTGQARYFFWPRLAHGEPDLVVLLEKRSGMVALVLVEAKYFSGKSSGGLEEEELELAVAPADQLAREYEDLLTLETQMRLHVREIDSRALLYVTAHRSMPTTSLEESRREVIRFHPDLPAGDLYWTSWFKLLPLLDQVHHIEEWERPIMDDLQGLLVKKGFVSFGGFESVSPMQVSDETAFYMSSRLRIEGMYVWEVRKVEDVKWYRTGLAIPSRSYFDGIFSPSELVGFYLNRGTQ